MNEEKDPMQMYEEFIESLIERRTILKIRLLGVDMIINSLNLSGLPFKVNLTILDEEFKKRHPEG